MQNTSAADFLGIKLNLVLIVLSPLVFFVKDWRHYLALVLIAGLLLSAAPIRQLADWPAFFLMIALLVAYGLKNIFPWQSFFNNLILLAAITAAVDFPVFLPLEIILNVVLGTMVYYIFRKKWQN